MVLEQELLYPLPVLHRGRTEAVAARDIIHIGKRQFPRGALHHAEKRVDSQAEQPGRGSVAHVKATGHEYAASQ